MDPVTLNSTHYLVRECLQDAIENIEADNHFASVILADLARKACGSLNADRHTRATTDLIYGIALIRYGKWLKCTQTVERGKMRVLSAFQALRTIAQPESMENCAVAALVLERYGDALYLLDWVALLYAQQGDPRRTQVVDFKNRIVERIGGALDQTPNNGRVCW